MSHARYLLVLLLLAWTPTGARAQRLLADINVRGASTNPEQVAALGERLFFIAEDETGEDALWFSDGFAGSERRVETPEDPRIWSADDDWVYFEADTDDFGYSLWVTNGEESREVDATGFVRFLGRTARGPVFGDPVDDELYVVADGAKEVLLSGTERSYRAGFEADGELTIVAVSSGLMQLWKTDGTAANTRLLHFGYFANLTSEGIHFGGQDLVVGVREGLGWQLFDIPGDFSDPVAITDLPAAPRDLVISGGLLFFTVQVGADILIYTSNGTAQGVRRILGPESEWAPNLWLWAPLLGGVVFSGGHPEYGTELLFADQSGVRLLADIFPGSGDSSPRFVASDGDRVYFSAEDHRGRELWVTDGTADGTRILVDLASGPASADPDRGILTEDAVCLLAETVADGREVWCIDKTSGEARLGADLRPSGTDPSDPERLFVWRDQVVFEADDGHGGRQVWTTDGSEAGTRSVTKLPEGRRRSSHDRDRVWVESEDYLYFADLSGIHRLGPTGSAELFGPPWVHPGDVEVVGSRVFASMASRGVQPPGLVWLQTGGDETPPRRVFTTEGMVVESGNLFRVGNRVLWFGGDGFGNTAVWSADSDGAQVLWGVATNGWEITSAVEHGGHLYFTVSQEGSESIWVTDGTQEGSRSVWTGPPGREAYGIAAFANGLLLFGGVDREEGVPLFFNPQSGEVTVLGVPGRASSLATQRWIVAGPGLAYFAARREIWRSDGTPSGTWMVARMDESPDLLGAAGTRVLFRYDDNVHGAELWAADDSGVRMVGDLYPGPVSSNPGPVVQLGSSVVFAADDPVVGRELFIMPASEIRTAVESEETQENVPPPPYPNPATDWVVQPLGADWRQGQVRVEVFDLLGRRVALPADGVPPGPRLRFSVAGWASGVYLVRITGPEGRWHYGLTVQR